MLKLVFKDYAEYKSSLRGIPLGSLITLVYYDNRGEPHNIGFGCPIQVKPYTNLKSLTYFQTGRTVKVLSLQEPEPIEVLRYGAYFHDGSRWIAVPDRLDELEIAPYVAPELLASPFKFITENRVDTLLVDEGVADLTIQPYVAKSDVWFYSSSLVYIDDILVALSPETYTPVETSDFWFFTDVVQYIQTPEEFGGITVKPYTPVSDFWFFSEQLIYIYPSESDAGLNFEPYIIASEEEYDIDIPDDSYDYGESEEGGDIDIPVESEGESDDGFDFGETDEGEDYSIPDNDTNSESDDGFDFGETGDEEGYGIDEGETDWGSLDEEPIEQESSQDEVEFSSEVGVSEHEEAPWEEPSVDSVSSEVQEVQVTESVAGADDIKAVYKERVETIPELRKYIRAHPKSTRKDLLDAGISNKLIAKALAGGKLVRDVDNTLKVV